MTMNSITVAAAPDLRRNLTADLAEHAREIRRLGNQAKADLIEIGRRLTEAKKLAGRGRWLQWLDAELGWEPKAAERLIALYKFSQAKIFEFDKLSNLRLPVSALYLLAAPSAPAGVRDEIVERAQAGEALSFAQVKTSLQKAKTGGAKRAAPGKQASPKSRRGSSFDALRWWLNAGPAEHMHFLDALGLSAIAAAAPPSWLNDGENSAGELARLLAHVAELECEVAQRDLTIAGLRRELGMPVDDWPDIPPSILRLPPPDALEDIDEIAVARTSASVASREF